jgi:NAD(P)-dependent dehydrogenase (short-subunit alcohol dehydrogenase family)
MSSTFSSNQKFDLTGKWGLVTGGAGLLGKQHSIALLELGANLVIWDVDESKLLDLNSQLRQEFPKARIIATCVDITSETDVKNEKTKLNKASIAVSILINNAALNPKYTSNETKLNFSRVENLSLEDWNNQILVGLTGAFICSKIFGSEMAEVGYGIILNISSDLSVISPDQRIYKIGGIVDTDQPVKPITYSVIKSGLIGLTKYLSTYWSDKGVRVNALSPGGVYENQDQEFVSKLTKLIPLGRMANADEYRSAVQFLCSDASSYMTGQNLIIDGGRSVW